MDDWIPIRAFVAGDYEGVVRVENHVYPEYGDTVEEWRHGDAHRDPKIQWGRYVAVHAGHIVGFGGYSQAEGMYHPRKFMVNVTVDKEHRGQGLGSRLYERVLGAIDRHDPIGLHASAREDMPEGIEFLESRGYSEVLRQWENHLDVATFDPAPFEGIVASVRESGVEMVSLADLASDPERDSKLYDLVEEVRMDVPSPGETTAVEFDTWRNTLFSNPNLLQDGYFIAVSNGAYVGLSTLYSSQGTSDFYTGLTGTRRRFRRRGIALALKLLAIDYAKKRGTPRIRTWNATYNEGMLAINDRLGFVRQPAWIDYFLELTPDAAASDGSGSAPDRGEESDP